MQYSLWFFFCIDYYEQTIASLFENSSTRESMLKKQAFFIFAHTYFQLILMTHMTIHQLITIKKKFPLTYPRPVLKIFFSSNLYFIRARLVLKIGLGLLRVFGKPPRQAKVSSQGENMIILSIYKKNISSAEYEL